MHFRSSFFPARALILLALPLLGCGENHPTAPAPTATASAVAAPPSAEPAPTAANPAPSASEVLPPREIAGAAHILVAYSGAELAAKTVTRSKDAAKKRAAEALSKITKDKMPFEEAAKKYSDDPGSKDLGGAIGNFERNAMPEAFSKATFAMKVGDISEVVETPRGFHIIKRTR
jgi:parvulin-like peptidyl-prolyl cis-trans isomerase-like protein